MIVDVFTTLNSPWAYLGWAPLATIRQNSDATFRIRPAKFAEVFAATGGLPLAQRPPARRAYRLQELHRWAKRRNRPLVLAPKYAPCDETRGVHMLIAAQEQGFDALKLAEEIGRALWELDQDIAQEQVLTDAAHRAQIPIASLAEALEHADRLNAQWAANTAEALARGVFGAPSYVLPSNEFFWGQDRLEFLAEALAQSQAPATGKS